MGRRREKVRLVFVCRDCDGDGGQMRSMRQCEEEMKPDEKNMRILEGGREREGRGQVWKRLSRGDDNGSVFIH